LPSQYLNELVRDGLIVKVNARPVLFPSPQGPRTLSFRPRSTVPSMLPCETCSLRSVPSSGCDYDKAIGLRPLARRLRRTVKSAMCYPPNGLPVLIVGEHGTGKSLISHLTYEYGVNSGVLPQDSRFVPVDCSRYGDNGQALERDVFGNASVTGGGARGQRRRGVPPSR